MRFLLAILLVVALTQAEDEAEARKQRPSKPVRPQKPTGPGKGPKGLCLDDEEVCKLCMANTEFGDKFLAADSACNNGEESRRKKPSRPSKPGRPSEHGRPSKPGRPSEHGRPSKPGRPSKHGRPSKPERPGKPERPSKPERPGKPRKPGKPSKPSKPERPSKPSKPERPSKPSKPQRPSKPSKPSRPGKPGKPNKPAKCGTVNETIEKLDEEFSAGKCIAREMGWFDDDMNFDYEVYDADVASLPTEVAEAIVSDGGEMDACLTELVDMGKILGLQGCWDDYSEEDQATLEPALRSAAEAICAKKIMGSSCTRMYEGILGRGEEEVEEGETPVLIS